MRSWWRAIYAGGRSLSRVPTFSWSVIVLLGLGVGAVTTIFSIVDHVVLRPLPYPAADRLVEVENGSHSGPTVERLRSLASVESWAAVTTRFANLTGGPEPLRVVEAQIDREFFPLFGARPAVGRLLVSEFETGEGVVLSYGAWHRLWGGDPAVVGRTIRVDGVPRVVVGVLDASFVAPEALRTARADIWRPLDPADERLRRDDTWMLDVAGRLAPGVTIERARSEAAALAARRAEEVPDQYLRDGEPEPLPLTPLQQSTAGAARPGLGLIFGAVVLLLLVACVNVAHLFMARGVERAREMSVRRALGARTPALARPLAIESLLLGLAGAGLGIVLAAAGVAAFKALGPDSLPRMASIAVDLRVLAFAAATGVLTALGFGLLPSLRLAAGGREMPIGQPARGSTGARRTQLVRNVLVVAEVALSLVLVAQAGWLLRTFADLHEVDLGFRTENVWTIPLNPTGIERPEEWAIRIERVRQSLAAVPGVERAAFGISMPLENVGGNRCCWRSPLSFHEADEQVAMIHPVDADYFELFALRLRAGSAWRRDEQRWPGQGAALPAVLSEPLAVAAFGSAADAVGRAFELADAEFRVVGVVADNRHYGPDQDHGPAAYIPPTALPFPPEMAHAAVLLSGPRPGLERSLAAAVWRADPELPVPVVRSMDDWAATATARARFVSALFTAFGAVALVLVAGGLAGTLLYTVRVRRRELGIRMALGASPARVERSVLGRGFRLAATGIAIGAAGAWAAGRLLEGLVAEIQLRDIPTFAATVALLLTVAVVSSWIPARRAAATELVETLKED